MNGGIATLAVFMLIAVIITVLGTTQGHPVLIAVAMINALLGALIGLPLVIAGKVRVSQASRLLSNKDSRRSIDSERMQNLNAGYESKLNRLPPRSVTEHTTLHLNNKGEVRRRNPD
jgi:hypothetical protein